MGSGSKVRGHVLGKARARVARGAGLLGQQDA
jgi:hypothetical protein